MNTVLLYDYKDHSVKISKINKNDAENYLHVAGIVDESCVDGPGIRFTIFFQGCDLNCHGCQNPQTRSNSGGIYCTNEYILYRLSKSNLTTGVTFSGGEPSLQAKNLISLAQKINKLGYDICIYSGHTYEQLIKNPFVNKLLKECDILVDGPFIEKLKTLNIPFVGSSNQRVINLKI